MGVKIIIHIRHIRGHTFDVEIDRDADCIGLKVAIWDLQKVPVEHQRLVYAGKEVADEVILVELGIDDGSTIFLVETAENVIPQAPVVESQIMEVVEIPEDSVSVPIEPMSVSSQHYAPLVDDRAREERIQATIDLAFWVKIYCLFGIIISLIALIGCSLGFAISLICYTVGYVACRKLNRCALIFPLLMSILIGPVGFVAALWHLARHFWAPWLVALAVSFLHLFIMMSIVKLRRRIKHLSPQEKNEAVERIRARRCC